MRRLALTMAGLLLAACSLDPDYDRPELPVANVWPADGQSDAAPGAGALSADTIGWRDFFKDRELQELIAIALRNNRDLRVAMLNVESAEAQYRLQRSDLFPKLGLSGGEDIVGIPAASTIPVGGPQTSAASGGGAAAAQNETASSFASGGGGGGVYRYYSLGGGITGYELDLFGRLRSLTREAFEEYLSSAETRRSSQIALVAEIGSGYLTYLSDRALLRLTEQTLANQQQSYKLTKLMFEEGATNALSLRQAETSVDTAAANLAQYQRQVQQDLHLLTLLLGQPLPKTLPPGNELEDQQLIADLPAGLPSDLLTRRPDVRAAEHTLLAANADIGAARAAFFPSITLTASGGVASNKLNKLFTEGATTWAFSPQINLPIFTAGENEANLDIAKIRKLTEVANYEKTIQTAFREVSDALTARKTYAQQLTAQQALVAAAQESYKLSEMRFREGVDNYLTALDAQRVLYAAQQNLITLRAQQEINLVTLYKSLGGGWKEHTAQQVAAR